MSTNDSLLNRKRVFRCNHSNSYLKFNLIVAREWKTFSYKKLSDKIEIKKCGSHNVIEYPKEVDKDTKRNKISAIGRQSEISTECGTSLGNMIWVYQEYLFTRNNPRNNNTRNYQLQDNPDT